MKYSIKEGRISLSLEAVEMGKDLNISLFGGNAPHLGAVAVSALSTAAASGKMSYSVSVIPVPGHKEDLLAREMALLISKNLNRNCSLSCGIHLDNIQKDEISKVMKLSELLCMKFIDEFSRNKAAESEEIPGN